MSDKTLTCGECRTAFQFTSAEQAFYTSRGYTTEPGRCRPCRNARKQGRSSGRRGYEPRAVGQRERRSALQPRIDTPARPIAETDGRDSDPTEADDWNAHAPTSSVVASVTSFEELALRPETRAVVVRMGISTPTPIQSQAIPAMLDGLDVVGQARTGSGKTLAFALPIVERCDPTTRGVQALVLVPTRELAIQVGEVIGKLAVARRMRLTMLYGGRALRPEQQALAAGAQIVVGTPGRTLDHLRQGTLSLSRLRIFVLDEGDEMLDRGFAPDVERILAQTPRERQTALFSATVPEWVMATAAKHLRNPVMVQVDRELNAPPEIEHVVYEVDTGAKLDALRTLLDRRGDGPVLVFGRTKHGVKKLARKLELEGFPVGALQGNLSQNARERVMAGFRSGAVPILLATNVAARGLDVEGIGQVINYEVPESGELFTHRVGRTGRMGRQGEAITLVSPEEAPKWRQIERMLGRSLPRTPWPGGSGTPERAQRIEADEQRPVRRSGGDRPFRSSWRRGPRPVGDGRPKQPARSSSGRR